MNRVRWICGEELIKPHQRREVRWRSNKSFAGNERSIISRTSGVSSARCAALASISAKLKLIVSQSAVCRGGSQVRREKKTRGSG